MVIRTGAFARARAAASPPKPAPTMTTWGTRAASGGRWAAAALLGGRPPRRFVPERGEKVGEPGDVAIVVAARGPPDDTRAVEHIERRETRDLPGAARELGAIEQELGARRQLAAREEGAHEGRL